MYVFLIGDDNTLQTTQKQRIMQRSKLVDDLIFLANPIYNGYDMSQFTLSMEYVLPISREYQHEILVLSDERYDGTRLKYTLPIDTKLTKEFGEVEIKLTFLLADLDESGNPVQRVRKIGSGKLEIIPVSAWSEIIPDSALSALDQRIIKTDAQIKALEEMNLSFNDSKADNLVYNKDNGELQLTANRKPIGDKVIIESTCDGTTDNVVIIGEGGEDAPSDNYNDVVEF